MLLSCLPCSKTIGERPYQIYDLSYPLGPQTILWPGDTASIQLCVSCSRSEEYGYDYAAGDFKSPEHAGTHVDAPFHFNKNGITVDQISLQQLIAPCKVIDIEEKCENDRDYSLSVEDIVQFEEKYGSLEPNDIVLIRTGWHHKYGLGSKQYLGYEESIDGPYDSSKHELSFPGIGLEAANYLVLRRVTAVGLDTASLDSGKCQAFLAHTTLLGAGIYGIENVNQEIARLPPIGSTLMVMPMKLVGGTGSPSRVIALVS